MVSVGLTLFMCLQADICHAYQIFYRHGVPDSNIIVMMYDDIANNDKSVSSAYYLLRNNL